LQDAKGKPADLTILRRGQEMKVKVQPVLDKAEGENEAFYRIGVGSERITVQRLPLGEAWRTRSRKIVRTPSCWASCCKKLVRGKLPSSRFLDL